MYIECNDLHQRTTFGSRLDLLPKVMGVGINTMFQEGVMEPYHFERLFGEEGLHIKRGPTPLSHLFFYPFFHQSGTYLTEK